MSQPFTESGLLSRMQLSVPHLEILVHFTLRPAVFEIRGCRKSELRPHITGPYVYTFHAIEPAYKDHMCIRRHIWGGLYIQVSLSIEYKGV